MIYAHSVKQLSDYMDNVPLGWRPAFKITLRKLLGVDHWRRHDCCVLEPQRNEGGLKLSVLGSDPVVTGIIRKTNRIFENTCINCGRRGVLRDLNFTVNVICNRCSALVIVERELAKLLTNLEKEPNKEIWQFENLNHLVTLVIGDDGWNIIHCNLCHREHRFVTAKTLNEKIVQLRKVMSAASEKFRSGGSV